MEGDLLHYCADGHHWTQKLDGGVGPSWGFGLTSIHYEGWANDRCPEPQRGWSIYDDEYDPTGANMHHAYRCPTCGDKHYIGGCLMGVRIGFDKTKDKCVPPEPVCGKPPVRTMAWVTPPRRRGNEVAGWIPVAEYERNGQLILEVPA